MGKSVRMTYRCIEICPKCNEFILKAESRGLPSDRWTSLDNRKLSARFIDAILRRPTTPSRKVHRNCQSAISLQIKSKDLIK
jgi:hypothetical protein